MLCSKLSLLYTIKSFIQLELINNKMFDDTCKSLFSKMGIFDSQWLNLPNQEVCVNVGVSKTFKFEHGMKYKQQALGLIVQYIFRNFYKMILPQRFSSRVASMLLKQKVKSSYFTDRMVEPQVEYDQIFVRHAHSEFNKACQEYRIKNNLQYDWDALSSHSGFADAVAYNPDYIDCSITKNGIQQCYSASHSLDFGSIDLLIVSPHQRALETCANLIKFSNQKYQKTVIVEPLLAGSLWSSCDISKSLNQKIREFSSFNFSRMVNHSDLWFLQNLSQIDRLKIQGQIQKRKITSLKDKQLLVLEMIRNKEIEQDRETLRKRAWQIKMRMQKLKKKHTRVLTISHYYVIQYVNTRSFDDITHHPTDDIDLKNCYPYYNNLQTLLSSQ